MFLFWFNFNILFGDSTKDINFKRNMILDEFNFAISNRNNRILLDDLSSIPLKESICYSSFISNHGSHKFLFPVLAGRMLGAEHFHVHIVSITTVNQLLHLDKDRLLQFIHWLSIYKILNININLISTERPPLAPFSRPYLWFASEGFFQTSLYLILRLNKIKISQEMSMYITQTEEGTIIQPQKKPPTPTNRNPSSTTVRLHVLQEYVSNVFNGCSLPPLDEFLQLEIEGQDVKIDLKNYKNSDARQQQENPDDQFIYYVYAGRANLQKDNQQYNSQQNQQQQLSNLRMTIISPTKTFQNKSLYNKGHDNHRNIEVKENNFFTLTTFKKHQQQNLKSSLRSSGNNNFVNQGSTLEKEKLRMAWFENGEYGRCLIGKIKINPKYNSEWYLAESKKYQFISSVVNGENGDISEHKLKGLARFFKQERYRRGTSLVREDQTNDRLFIVVSGQCQYTKNFYHDEKNHSNLKTLKVANCGSKAVVGSQFLLFQFYGMSKSATVTVKALQSSYKNNNIEFQVNNGSQSNFTVSVLSAFAEVYYISVSKFKDLCGKYVEEVPSTLRKNIENGYVTIIRNLKEKMDIQIVKLARNQQTKSQQRVLFEARVQSGQYKQFQKRGASSHGSGNPHPEEEQPEDLSPKKQQPKGSNNLKITKSELKQTNLQGGNTEMTRAKRLEKKIQMIMNKDRSNVNYKKKIEGLLMEKITQKKNINRAETPSPMLLISSQHGEQQSMGQEVSPSRSPEQNKKIAKDLEDIFMNKDDGARTLSIQRQNDILRRKQSLLKKRYSSSDNVLIVHQQTFDKKKNKLFKMDLIRKGALDLDKELRETIRHQSKKKPLNMDIYSSKIKKQCIEKINRANKIKEQFMTIKSQCENCHCYENIQGIYQSTTQKDFKYQTMKTGSAWRLSESRNSVTTGEQPLEKLHSRTKFLSEKSASKYQHNKHLISKRKGMMATSQRRLSAPLI